MATAQKERQILRAAERLFASRRFHEVTMDDVSKAARVGKGTIYRYFKDKDDLFARMVSSGFDELCEAVGRISSQDLPFEMQLGRVLTAIRRFFKRRHPLFRMMQSEQARIAVSHSAIQSHWLKRRHDLDRGVADVLRRGVKAGVVRKDVPPERLAACLLGMLRGTAFPPCGREAKELPVAMVVDLFLRGAEARPAAD